MRIVPSNHIQVSVPDDCQLHELDIWSSCYAAIEAGTKPFDVRLNDRNFRAGDALLLREFDPETGAHSGRIALRWASHVLQGGAFGIEAGWCVLGLAEHPPLPAGISDTRLW